MKINLTDYITKTGRSVSMTEAERAKIRGVLSEYMAMKPVRGADANKKPVGTVEGWYFFMRKPVAIALLIAFAASGAGVSYASEQALPGDILYTVKVSVNEEVRAALAVSAEAKAAWEAERAEKRLAEAGALAAKGKLTEKAEDDILARFEKHADRAAERVAFLEASDSPAAIGVASGFEIELEAHAEILDDLKGGSKIRESILKKAERFALARANAENASALAPVPSASVAVASEPVAMMMKAAPAPSAESADAGVAADSASFALRTSNSDVDSRASAARKMAGSAKDELKKVNKLLARAGTKFVAEEKARIDASIAFAETRMREADAALASADYATAFHGYQEAFVSLKKLEVFLNAAVRANIKILIKSSSPEREPGDDKDVSHSDSGSGRGETPTEPVIIKSSGVIDRPGVGESEPKHVEVETEIEIEDSNDDSGKRGVPLPLPTLGL